MDIEMDAPNHQFDGTQKLVYYNNSPDTLEEVYYHLYFNAFQPGSMMDVRSRNIPDPDKRIGDRISKLNEQEIGYHQIQKLEQNGTELQFEISETLLQAELAEPLLPGDSAVFNMEFSSQVPLQIRRSGRDNEEGIDFTMTQWYPKMAAYDDRGWHLNPYVFREFYAPFGEFTVNINMHRDYQIGGTGILQNFDNYWETRETGDGLIEYRYLPGKDKRRTWTLHAENVHTFAWAADKKYLHYGLKNEGQPDFHFYFLKKYRKNWQQLPQPTAEFFDITSRTFGKYPYPQFSVIQGGDGGMEYPMCTMLKGTGKLKGLIGVMAHESAHSWYYGAIGTNEFQYPWMDEGFTSFAETYGLNMMKDTPVVNPYRRAFRASVFLHSPRANFEPLSTPADYFSTNQTYGISAYTRGEAFLAQLKYILGDEEFFKGMQDYWNTFRFRHPRPFDFIKSMENTSGVHLKWYLNYWMNTNHKIDYAIDTLTSTENGTTIALSNPGTLPMPQKVTVEMKDGSQKTYYIPLLSMLGHTTVKGYQYLEPWRWTHPEYSFTIKEKLADIQSVILDKYGFTADVDRRNNSWPASEE